MPGVVPTAIAMNRVSSDARCRQCPVMRTRVGLSRYAVAVQQLDAIAAELRAHHFTLAAHDHVGAVQQLLHRDVCWAEQSSP